MTSAQDELLDHVSAMGRELAPSTIAGLASDISAGRTALPPNPRVRVLRERLDELWRGASDVSPGELSWALLAAQRAASNARRAQTLSLVWTGPDTDVPVRRNDEALYEVVASAERELLVVSFVVYRVPRVRQGITEAVERGVDVRLVVERHAPDGEVKEEQFDPIRGMGELPPSVRVLEWALDRRPKLGKRLGYIHAKCAVADRTLATISSANLTAYGLEANMELGVLVKGGSAPPRIAEQFTELEARGELVPVRQS
jgi:phosphatidylserine/phosphatidylglycerophosphate/cardiolipin synthase-like enzyme